MNFLSNGVKNLQEVPTHERNDAAISQHSLTFVRYKPISSVIFSLLLWDSAYIDVIFGVLSLYDGYLICKRVIILFVTRYGEDII